MCIYFKEIERAISDRNKEIEMLHQQVQKFISVDAKLNVIINPDFKEQAREIRKRLVDLKEKNDYNGALHQKGGELIQKYGLTGWYFPNPDILDLDSVKETLLENDIGLGEEREERKRILESIQKADEELGQFYANFWLDYVYQEDAE